MYKQIPLAIEVSQNTAGIHTPQVHVVIAAPGAGKALRIIAYSVSLVDNAPAGYFAEIFAVGDGAGVTGMLNGNLGQGTAGSGLQVYLPEPGVQLGINKNFQMSSRGSVATQALHLSALYFIDNVS